jgi:hypothetical protein
MTRPITPLTLAEYRALVTGIPQYCSTAKFFVGGQTLSATQAVGVINTVLNAVSATASAKTGWKDAMIAEAAAVATNGASVHAIRDIIATSFQDVTTTLAAFEIAPRKVRQPLSAAARMAANAKAAATRKARGTTSKAQKAKIVGNVTGVTVTPITSSSSSPAPSAPTVAASAPPVAVSAAPTQPIPAASAGTAAPLVPSAAASTTLPLPPVVSTGGGAAPEPAVVSGTTVPAAPAVVNGSAPPAPLASGDAVTPPVAAPHS